MCVLFARFSVFLCAVVLLGSFGCGDGSSDQIVNTNDERPVFEFSPREGRLPEPNAMLVNSSTGLIDFSLVGIDVPAEAADCSDSATFSLAQCEVYVFLEKLDGFGTDSVLRAPVTEAIDMATVVIPDNLYIVAAPGLGVPIQDVDVSYDADAGQLLIARSAGWDEGYIYLVAIRGYDSGVVTSSGYRIEATAEFAMMKEERSLVTCEPDPQTVAVYDQVLVEECELYQKLLVWLPAGEAADYAFELEASRRYYGELFDALVFYGGPEKQDVVIAWAFPTHSNPAVVYDPRIDAVPVVAGNTIRIAVRGELDPGTVTASTSGLTGLADATVMLLDLVAAAAQDLDNSFPDIQVSLDQEEIVIESSEPLVAGHQYLAILVSNLQGGLMRAGITDWNGLPLAPSLYTVLLRGRGTLVDGQGNSNVAGVHAEEAVALEEVRLLLDELLYESNFAAVMDLQREQVAYVAGFEPSN